MRLFTLPTGTIDAEARTFWLLPPFDLEVLAGQVPEVVGPICVSVSDVALWEVAVLDVALTDLAIASAATWGVACSDESVTALAIADRAQWAVATNDEGCG